LAEGALAKKVQGSSEEYAISVGVDGQRDSAAGSIVFEPSRRQPSEARATAWRSPPRRKYGYASRFTTTRRHDGHDGIIFYGPISVVPSCDAERKRQPVNDASEFSFGGGAKISTTL
jgi:hypothetical protein